MKNNFSKNLKHYRKQKHMSQEELSSKLSISRQALSSYEVGKRTCSFDTLIDIADIFGISVDELIR